MLVAELFEMLLHVIQEVRVNDNNLKEKNQELLFKKKKGGGVISTNPIMLS